MTEVRASFTSSLNVHHATNPGAPLQASLTHFSQSEFYSFRVTAGFTDVSIFLSPEQLPDFKKLILEAFDQIQESQS